MFGRNKKEPEKKRNHDLSQFGLFDPTEISGNDSDGNDSDLEAELAAITSGSGGARARPKPKPKTQIPSADLDRMVADSLKDDDDDDSDIDENDPDLLNELSEIAGSDVVTPDSSPPPSKLASLDSPTSDNNVMVDLLTARLEMYRIAESNAKAANDSGKARRFGRGFKTLQDLLKQAKTGKLINMDDVPPEVSVKVAAAVVPQPAEEPSPPPSAAPTRVAPAPPTPIEPKPSTKVDEQVIATLLTRQREYKVAALTAKKMGQTDAALGFVKIAKMFDAVIKAAQDGQPVDLSDMPPPPSELPSSILAVATAPTEPAKEESESQNRTEEPSVTATTEVNAENLVTASTILEALQQRLDKYKSVEQAAKDEDNTSKARRFGRIVKQYEDAVKRYKAGKPVAYDELPTPPGFGPIPGIAPAPSADAAGVGSPIPASQPVAPPRNTPIPDQPTPPSRPKLQKQESSSRLSGNHSNTTVMNKTITLLLERQKEFRAAAVEAKRNGDLETAKEYLKIFKGLENMLDVARGGLPVDLNTLPIPPSQRANLEDSFTIINDSDCSSDGLGDISIRLEEQLQGQLAKCKATRDHHKALGDIAGTNRFENLALSVQKDYDLVKYARKKNLPVPKFHYEQKSFNIVRCNTDLTDTELEINVIRGISYSVPNPKDVDTYIKLEFPYPQETPFRTKTQLIRDTDSPVYNEKFMVEIQPKQRQCQRVFKRHGIKLEVYSRGGFLRSDVLIGTATVKLQPLETACEIHDSFDLMDGRKTNGGKLEIRVRIRNPILTKQVEHTDEKWLVIDT